MDNRGEIPLPDNKRLGISKEKPFLYKRKASDYEAPDEKTYGHILKTLQPTTLLQNGAPMIFPEGTQYLDLHFGPFDTPASMIRLNQRKRMQRREMHYRLGLRRC